MGKPLISIIVPIYNVEAFLDECLASIANQTNKSFIALLINDGSTDNSLTIAQRYVNNHPELFKLYTKENGGLSDARNYGITEVGSDYVMFVDSDDIIALDTIEQLSNAINSSPADILCFGMTEISESGKHIRNISPTIGSLNPTSLRSSPALMVEALPNACNKVIKTSLFTSNNLKFPEGLWYEDLATTPKLFDKANSVSFLNSYLYHYRTREGSITQTISPKIMDMIKVLKSLDDYFPQHTHLSDVLATLKLNMLMKTLVRISASSDTVQQTEMIASIQCYMRSNMPNTLSILTINGKSIYKFTVILAALKLNKLLLGFLNICLKKGLVRT